MFRNEFFTLLAFQKFVMEEFLIFRKKRIYKKKKIPTFVVYKKYNNK